MLSIVTISEVTRVNRMIAFIFCIARNNVDIFQLRAKIETI